MAGAYERDQLIWLAQLLKQKMDAAGKTPRALVIEEFNKRFPRAQPLTVGRLSRIYLDNGQSVTAFIDRYKDAVPTMPRVAQKPKRVPASKVVEPVPPVEPSSEEPEQVTPPVEELPQPAQAMPIAIDRATEAELGRIIAQAYLDWNPYEASFVSAHALAAKMVNDRLGGRIKRRYSANDIEILVRKAGGTVELLLDSGINLAAARSAAEQVAQSKYSR